MSNDTTTAEAQARAKAHEAMGWPSPDSLFHSANAGEYAGVKFGPKSDLHYDEETRGQCNRLTALILTYERTLAESDVSRAPDCAKCRGTGRCEPTLAEAKAAAGIETPKGETP